MPIPAPDVLNYLLLEQISKANAPPRVPQPAIDGSRTISFGLRAGQVTLPLTLSRVSRWRI